MKRSCVRGIRGKSAGLRPDENGFSIVAAAVALFIFSVLGFAAAGMVSVGARGTAAAFESQQAFHIAEAGIRAGTHAAAADLQWLLSLEGNEEFRLGTGVFTLAPETFLSLEEKYYYDRGEEKAAWTEGYAEGEGEQHKTDDFLHLEAGAGGSERTFVTGSAVDLSAVEILLVDWQGSAQGGARAESYLALSKIQYGDSSQYDARLALDGTFGRNIHSLDTSGMSGEYYLRLHSKNTHPNHGTSELNVFRVWGLSWETRVRRIVSSGYVPGKENYRAKRVIEMEFPVSAAAAEDIFSVKTVYVMGSSQIHGIHWESSQPVTAYIVASNHEIITGPSPNAFITADTQLEFVEQEVSPVEIPAGLESMDYISQGDPGITGSYKIDEAGNFYMGNFPYRPHSTIHSGTYKFNDLDLFSNVELFIDGSVTLYLTGRLYMPGTSEITLMDGSSLTVYLGSPGGELVVQGNSRINRGERPSDVVFLSASQKMVDLFGNVHVNALIITPEADIKIQGSSQLWGAVVCGGLDLIGSSRFYCVKESVAPAPPLPGKTVWKEVIR